MRFTFLAVFLAIFSPACWLQAQNETGASGMIRFDHVPPSQVLPVYARLADVELTGESGTQLDHYLITLVCTNLSREKTVSDLERAFREQAGIVITKIDEKKSSVKFDPSLPITNTVQATVSPKNKLVFTVSSSDVDTNSVKLLASPETGPLNLAFNLPGKTSDEIKAIKPGPVHIQKNGHTVAVAPSHSYLLEKSGEEVIYRGLILFFKDKDAAKRAEMVLKGQ